jgi:lipoyl(octanoyl) transferase
MSGTSSISSAAPCQACYLGVIEYAEALRLQERLVAARIAGDIPDTILFLQHPPVITMGISAREENIIASKESLKNEGIAVVCTDRGGDITVHEPGQLVCYPVFDLKTKARDLHLYVRNLEEAVIRTLSEFSIAAHRESRYPGVWVGDEKICAIGIHVEQWVTKHGFALNVNNDLRCFSFVHPCGITDKRVTSMSRLLGHKLHMENVMLRLIENCSQVFRSDIKLKPPEYLGR